MNLVPQTDLARRVAAIVHRKPETPWSEKEIQLYKTLLKGGAFNETALKLVERYQAFHRKQRKMGRDGFHRRGLYTLLRWWGDELDRATEHDELHPVVKPPRVIIQMPPAPSEPFIQTPEEKKRTDLFMQQFSTFKRVKAEMGR